MLKSDLIRFTRLSFSLMSPESRQRYIRLVFIQSVLGIMDLIGIAILGIMGSLSIRGVESKSAGNRVKTVLDFLHLGNLDFKTQILILGFTAVAFLVFKTIFAIIFSRKILFFLGKQSSEITNDVLLKLISQPSVMLETISSQEVQYVVGAGIPAIILGILGIISSIFSDLILLIIIGIGIVAVDPITAISTLFFFSFVGLSLYLLLNKKAIKVGRNASEYNVQSNIKLLDLLFGFRELVVRNRRFFYYEKLASLRTKFSWTNAELMFLPNISKYVIEVSIIIGTLFISAIEFGINDSSRAIASLTLFFAAGTRISPALLRIQQSMIQIQANFGSAGPTFRIIESLNSVVPIVKLNSEVDFLHEGFNANVCLREISFTYPSKSQNTIHGLSLEVYNGQVVALVGASGAGKSTIVDILLGIHTPSTGNVTISGLTPGEAIEKWPGAIGYVPQNISFINGTIKENIGFGFEDSEISNDKVIECLKTVGLYDLVNSTPENINMEVGERGNKLSGGQKQRLGIARALYLQPKLLVLDEATSSLDAEIELSISNAVKKLKGSVTIIVIAHRLSTIMDVDNIFYIDAGKVKASGDFKTLRKIVPEFEKQAKLLGL